MNIYVYYTLIFLFGFMFGLLLMWFKLRSENLKLTSYKRKLEKESINSTESESKIKVLEAKIVVLEKALEKSLKK